MYAVSDAYKEAMKKPVQRFRMTGTVGDAEFTDKNILSGSFQISNQCSDTSNVQIGQVYTGELDVTLMDMSLTRYSLKDLKVIPKFGLMLGDGSYEDVPLGVYNISEANWTASGIVITAYDNMSLLDKAFTGEDVTNGEIYDMMMLACSTCGIEFGMSREECEALPNGTETLSVYTDNDMETWRDFVSWIAQTAGCNAFADRDGKIVLRQYGQDAVDTIDDTHRLTGASFSDFETRYTGISVVDIESQKTNYYAIDEDDGLTYNLGQNPLLQYGVETTLKRQRTAVLTALQQIKYVPFTASMIGNPAYDLMDVLVFSGGIADGDKLYCITKYTFKYHGEYAVEGVGQNPALASAKSKSDKNIAGLLSSSTKDRSTFYIYAFTSAKEFEFSTNETQVAEINFMTVDATTIDLIFMSNHEITLDGEVVVRVYLDGNLFNTYTDYEARGKHVLTLNWHFAGRANARYNVTVTMQWNLFISDRRIDAADRRTLWNYADSIVWAMARQNGTWSALQIFTWGHLENYTWDDLTGEEFGQNTWDDVLNGQNAINPNDIAYHTESPDESIGSIKIERGNVNAVIFGRGLAATDTWDGTITVSDRIPEHILKISPDPIQDAIVTKLITDVGDSVKDSVSEVGVQDIVPENFADALVLRDGMRWTPADTDRYTLTGDTAADGDHWKGAGTVTTANLEIGGTIIGAHMDTASDDVTFSFSFDGGTTWEGYVTSSGWSADVTNTRAQIEQIPRSAWSGITQIMIKAVLVEKSTMYEMNIYTEERLK